MVHNGACIWFTLLKLHVHYISASLANHLKNFKLSAYFVYNWTIVQEYVRNVFCTNLHKITNSGFYLLCNEPCGNMEEKTSL